MRSHHLLIPMWLIKRLTPAFAIQVALSTKKTTSNFTSQLNVHPFNHAYFERPENYL